MDIWEIDHLQIKLNHVYDLRNETVLVLAVIAGLFCLLLLSDSGLSVFFELAVFATLLYLALVAHLPVAKLIKDLKAGFKIKLDFLVDDIHETETDLILISNGKKLLVPLQLRNKVLINDVVSCEFAPKSLELFKLQILIQEDWKEVYSYKQVDAG